MLFFRKESNINIGKDDIFFDEKDQSFTSDSKIIKKERQGKYL